MEAGSTIELSVAVPVPTVLVPDLVGLTEEECLDELEDAGLEPGDRTEEYSDEVEAGHVISTDPAVDAARSPSGTERRLRRLHRPRARWPCPTSSTCTEADALAALDDADLLPGDMTEANDETIVEGNVISTDPAADAEVAPGSASTTSSPSAPSRWPCPISST